MILWDVPPPSLLIGPMPSIRLADRLSETAAFFAARSSVGPFATRGLPRVGGRGLAEAREALTEALERLGASRGAGLHAAAAVVLSAAHFGLFDKDVLLLDTEHLALTDTRHDLLDGGLGAFLDRALRLCRCPPPRCRRCAGTCGSIS